MYEFAIAKLWNELYVLFGWYVMIFSRSLGLKDESGSIRIFVTFFGKVPKYGYMVSPVRWDTYFLVNRVENQKLNQTTAELPFG